MTPPCQRLTPPYVRPPAYSAYHLQLQLQGHDRQRSCVQTADTYGLGWNGLTPAENNMHAPARDHLRNNRRASLSRSNTNRKLAKRKAPISQAESTSITIIK
jgi:hypothetical protein